MDSIYTYSGTILIAANPHKRIKHLYGPRMMAQYRGVQLGELSPHVYAIAEAAYSAMMADEQRQAILISGESGAGKTESAKMVMQYLAHRAGGGLRSNVQKRKNAGPDGCDKTELAEVSAPIEEQILESNPLLEAFGNAKTARNDNSSRFGKFVEIDFDAAGRVTGAAISTYLLERSRVVSIRPPERSFHIFYQLCAGADDDLRAKLHLGDDARLFRYLAASTSFELVDVNDAEAFSHTVEAMRIVGMEPKDIETTLRCVAAVLHLGNICFEEGKENHDEAAITGTPESLRAIDVAAELLGVLPDDLLDALTTRAIETRGERIVKRLDPAAAAESRDALAKSLYSRLFDWLVAAVNRKIGALGGGGRTARTIGILDIYGFEAFDTNSFEQLCINLANEKLQQAFNAHVFKGEQLEYSQEGIAWSYVDFVDNQDVLELLEGNSSNGSSNGVFPLIDEACRLPRATHADLAHALRTKLSSNSRFIAPRRDQHSFVIDHYAGEVFYSTEALLDKNRDFVVAEHACLMERSSVELLRYLFSAGDGTTGTAAEDAAAVSSPCQGALLKAQKRRSAFMLSSVGSRFRRQLSGLMTTLSECQPHFIRCIKPNPESRPGALTPSYVLEQLRAGGVLEAVRIACAGFPTRKPFLPFAQRYALLLGPHRLRELGLPMGRAGTVDWYTADEKEVIEIVKRVLYAAGFEGWQLGRTRVFMRSGLLAVLEGARGRVLAAAALTIQSVWRGFEARHMLWSSKEAARKIQMAWRGYLRAMAAKAAAEFAAAVRLQAAYRRHAARTSFLAHRRTAKATIIQSYWRRHMARRRFLEETEAGQRALARAAEEALRASAALLIQSQWRRILAQRHTAVLKRQAARYIAVQEERDAMVRERTALAAALAEAEARAVHAEADVAAKIARVATLESQVQELRAEADNARAEAMQAMSSGEAGVTEATRRATELETAHKHATDTLHSELTVAEQRAWDSEQRIAVVQERLTNAMEERDTLQIELSRVMGLVEAHEATIEELNNEMQAMARSYAAAREAQSVAVAAAAIEAAEVARAENLRVAQAASEAATTATAEVNDLKVQLESARRYAASRDAALRDAHEKGRALAARVEALSARAERLEADSREAAAREAALLAELEGAKRLAARTRPLSPLNNIGGATLKSPMHRTTPLRRTIAQELEAAASAINGKSPYAAGQGKMQEGFLLSTPQVSVVDALISAAVTSRLPLVVVLSVPAGTVTVPQASWLIHRSLWHWAQTWEPSDAAAAAGSVQNAIRDASRRMSLTDGAYWLSTCLAVGALLKIHTVGKRLYNEVNLMADGFMGLSDMHAALGAAVSRQIPVNVSQLLSDEAKRSARRRSSSHGIGVPGSLHGRQALAPVTNGVPGTPPTSNAAQCTPVTPPSPADAELADMGGGGRPWRTLLGGLANVSDVLRQEGLPGPAVQAVMWAALRFIDGELLNALLLRRECCSVSAARALQRGLAALKEISSLTGDAWAPGPEEAKKALEGSLQAVQYLIQGKDDCARKALHASEDYVLGNLNKQCPALTLQQVARLTEHQHDDWLAGAGSGVGTQTLALLETLQRLIAKGPGAVPDSSPLQPARNPTWVAFGSEKAEPKAREVPSAEKMGLEEEDLLVDSAAAFELFRRHSPVTRKLLTLAAMAYVTVPGAENPPSEREKMAGTAGIANPLFVSSQAGMTAPASPSTPGGPRLPDGSLPRLQSSPVQAKSGVMGSPASSEPTMVSLLDSINVKCLESGVPTVLSENPAFSFLHVV